MVYSDPLFSSRAPVTEIMALLVPSARPIKIHVLFSAFVYSFFVSCEKVKLETFWYF